MRTKTYPLIAAVPTPITLHHLATEALALVKIDGIVAPAGPNACAVGQVAWWDACSLNRCDDCCDDCEGSELHCVCLSSGLCFGSMIELAMCTRAGMFGWCC